MMANQSQAVDQFMHALEPPLKVEIETLRASILNANENITEHVKWNAPSFCYHGVDRMTFNLRAQDRLQLIFHRGAKDKRRERLCV